MNLYGRIIACIYPCKIRIAKLLLSSREGLSLNAYNDIMLQEYEIKDIFNGDEPGFCVFRKYKIAPMQTAKKDLGSWEISVTASIENYIEIALYEDKIGAEKPIYLSSTVIYNLIIVMGLSNLTSESFSLTQAAHATSPGILKNLCLLGSRGLQRFCKTQFVTSSGISSAKTLIQYRRFYLPVCKKLLMSLGSCALSFVSHSSLL